MSHPLLALSPLDGRYATKVEALRPIFSEFGLMQRRVLVEIRWLIALSDEPGIGEVAPFSAEARATLEAMAASFSEADGERIKAIESETNHDVKAVEYFIKERVSRTCRTRPRRRSSSTSPAPRKTSTTSPIR